MEAHLLQLPQRLLLLGAAVLTVSALETADLVDLCGQTWQGDGLLLRSHSASRRFYFVVRDTDCGLWVRAAAPSDRIRLQFRFFLVYSLTSAAPASPAPNASTPASADACAPGSYLQFYEGSCGPYFRCRNGRYIPPSLVCDLWGMDNCGDSSDQASWPPANCRGPSLMPSQEGSMEADTSKPLTVSPALGSAGPLQTAAGSSAQAGQGPAQQDAALEGPWLQKVALASSLLLASAGLLIGLLWCCCSSLASWPGGLVSVASALAAPSVTHVLARWPLGSCGGAEQPSKVREAIHREAAASEEGEWALETDRPWVLSHPPDV